MGMTNRIAEFFSDKEKGSGSELFRVTDENVDIKSEVSAEEERLVTVLMMNDKYLQERGIPPVYSVYYQKFLRLQISLDRKGRSEYVQVAKRGEDSNELLSKFGNISSMMRPRT